MSIKKSNSKRTKMLRMFLQGFTQGAIGLKVKVHQTTVSLLMTEFTSMVDAEGLDAAAEEYGVMDIVQELHSLGAECMANNLTIAEGKKGLKMAVVLENCGLEEDQFEDAIKAVIKANNQEYLDAAMELHIIEENSDELYSDIIKQASVALTQKEQTLKELQEAKDETAKEEQALAISQQKMANLEKNFNQVLQNTTGNLDRLKRIESLAAALKKAGATDNQIDWYIEQLNALNQAGISLYVFSQILDATNVSTSADGGKSLLKKLKKFVGLNEGVISLKQEQQHLLSETKDLNEKAKLRGKIQTDVNILQAREQELQGSIPVLVSQEQALIPSVKKLQSNEINCSGRVAALTAVVAEKEGIAQGLDQSISDKQNKVADLTSLEEQRGTAETELASLSVQTSEKRRQLWILDAIEGYMESSEQEKLKAFMAVLPSMLEGVNKGNHGPDFIRAHIFNSITGGKLSVHRCDSCGTRFFVDKPAKMLGYTCPVCWSTSNITTDTSATDILKATLATSEPERIIYVNQSWPVKKQQSK